MQVDFYHLTSNPVERILPRIAERLLSDSGRLLVCADDPVLLDRIDQELWVFSPESFLAHGRKGEGQEAQPILLSDDCEASNQARNIALVDGIWRDEALTFDRAFFLFPDERIGEARDAWRALGSHDGVERRFWKQDEAGRWSQAA